MLEILSKDDLDKIVDDELRTYIHSAFNELSDDLEYPGDGYFICIDANEEVEISPIKLILGDAKINKVSLDIFEDITQKGDIIEIFLVLDDRFWMSLVLHKSMLSDDLLQKLPEIVVYEESS